MCHFILTGGLIVLVGCPDLETLIQGVLFLFYEPNVDDALVPVGDFNDLIKLVEMTKYGGKKDIDIGTFEFSSVYEIPDKVELIFTLVVEPPETLSLHYRSYRLTQI